MLRVQGTDRWLLPLLSVSLSLSLSLSFFWADWVTISVELATPRPSRVKRSEQANGTKWMRGHSSGNCVRWLIQSRHATSHQAGIHHFFQPREIDLPVNYYYLIITVESIYIFWNILKFKYVWKKTVSSPQPEKASEKASQPGIHPRRCFGICQKHETAMELVGNGDDRFWNVR